MTRAEVIKTIEKVGEDFGWQMGKVGANYENGYMKAIRDVKNALEHIVEANKMVVTNADRIRNMTDEELAKHISCPQYFIVGFRCKADENEGDCYKCTLKWLKEKVE